MLNSSSSSYSVCVLLTARCDLLKYRLDQPKPERVQVHLHELQSYPQSRTIPDAWSWLPANRLVSDFLANMRNSRPPTALKWNDNRGWHFPPPSMQDECFIVMFPRKQKFRVKGCHKYYTYRHLPSTHQGFIGAPAF